MGTPYQALEVGDQYAARHRLQEEIIGTFVQRLGYHPWVADSRKNQKWNLAEGANFPADLPSVHIGHSQGQDNHLWISISGGIDSFRPGVCYFDIKCIRFEDQPQHFRHGDVVINDQDFGWHSVFHLKGSILLS